MTKRVRVTDALVAASPIRPSASVWDEWLSPAESPLPADAALDAIAIAYPPRAIDLLGFAFPWLVVFFVLTTVFMLLGRSFLHIVI
jgi:hypothetical protein